MKKEILNIIHSFINLYALASRGDSAMGVEGAVRLSGSSTKSDVEASTGGEDEGSHTEGRPANTPAASEDQSSSSDDSLVVVDKGKDSSTSESTTTPISILPTDPSVRGWSRGRGQLSFVPGTSPPAPVSPAALSAEAVDILRQISVGPTSVLNVLHVHTLF